jgi:hypothetical protein
MLKCSRSIRRVDVEVKGNVSEISFFFIDHEDRDRDLRNAGYSTLTPLIAWEGLNTLIRVESFKTYV